MVFSSRWARRGITSRIVGDPFPPKYNLGTDTHILVHLFPSSTREITSNQLISFLSANLNLCMSGNYLQDIEAISSLLACLRQVFLVLHCIVYYGENEHA